MTLPQARRGTLLVAGAAVVGLCLAGCGPKGPKLGQVEGTVTLDGAPLAGATIHFAPEGGGRTSSAVTDSAGKYKLEFAAGSPGAIVGKHKVTITTFEQGEIGDDGKPAGYVPEKVPAKYNRESTLVEEVKSGSQTIDFKLESK